MLRLLFNKFGLGVRPTGREMETIKLCMDRRNKIKVPDPVVKDLSSKK